MDNDPNNLLFKNARWLENVEPISFDDSFEKQAVDLIIKHIDERADKSDKEQRFFNIVLVIIGLLTLLVTIAGIVIQVVI